MGVILFVNGAHCTVCLNVNYAHHVSLSMDVGSVFSQYKEFIKLVIVLTTEINSN